MFAYKILDRYAAKNDWRRGEIFTGGERRWCKFFMCSVIRVKLNYLHSSRETYGPAARHIRKIIKSSLYSWTMYIIN